MYIDFDGDGLPRDVQLRIGIARRKDVPQKVFLALAGDEDVITRMYVAANELCSAEALGELARDSEEKVRVGVAGNRSTPISLLTFLAQDECTTVREYLAMNSSCPTATLEKLASDSSFKLYGSLGFRGSEVRYWALRNPSIPASVIESLSPTSDRSLR